MTLRMLILLVLGVFAVNSYAGGRYIGKVKPYYWGKGLYLAKEDVVSSSVPDCATRDLLRLQETNADDPIFKHKFSLLLAAWMAGKQVDLRGTGKCTGEGDEMVYVVIPL